MWSPSPQAVQIGLIQRCQDPKLMPASDQEPVIAKEAELEDF